MPHSVSPEPSRDVAMTGVAEDSPGNPQSDPPALALAVADAVNDSSDKENQKCLEDMFDDDSDDDNEFSSSAPPANGDDNSQQQRLVTSPLRSSSALTTFSKPAPFAKYSDQDVMRAFYQRLFPFRYLFQWLNHSPSPTNDFAHREFAFPLPNDAYLRYQSFPSADL